MAKASRVRHSKIQTQQSGELAYSERRGPADLIPIADLPLTLGAAIVIGLHFVALGDVPLGTYVDESSIGYNAYSILLTGADEHGEPYPLYFKAFGEYKNPLFVYGLVPLLYFFGLSTWTVRLAAALLGLGTAVLTGLIFKEVGLGKRAVRAGFILAGLTPWLFCLSRVGFEVIAFPFFLSLALWSWIKAINSQSLAWFLLSWSAWGISLFTYSTARLLIPVLVIALLGCYFRELRLRWTRVLLAALPFAFCLLLLLAWSMQHPGALAARFNEVSILKERPDFSTALYSIVSNYLDYFTMSFLFTTGDSNLRHHSGYGGELFVITLPALFAGLAVAWQRRQMPLERYVLLGFLLFPLAASMTRDPSHALRTVNALPFIFLLIFWGFQWMQQGISHQLTIRVLYGLIAIMEVTAFYVDYFYRYPTRARIWFGAGFEQVVKAALGTRTGNLYYSTSVFHDENLEENQTYIHFRL
jgi:4-amino-4-deoxy-L-arabinose transferase-like glycosyltransferase